MRTSLFGKTIGMNRNFKGLGYRLMIAVLIFQFVVPPQILFAKPDEPQEPPPSGSQSVPASMADLALSVNGRLVPGIDDPRAIEISKMIGAGQVTPAVLDFLVGQGLRFGGGTRILFSDAPNFDHPVPNSSNFDQVKIVASDGQLEFQMGNTPKDDPAFVPTLTHFIPGVHVAGVEGKQFTRTSANVYFVNKSADGKLDAVRAVSIPQAEGNAELNGALFKGTLPVTHAISLAHIPAGWEFKGISLLARNQRPRNLLRFDNFEPVPAMETGGEDIALAFTDQNDEERCLWVPQEIINQFQLRRLEQLTWLALLDNGGVDEKEKKELVAFLESMAAETQSIEQAKQDLRAIREASGDSLVHSDLVYAALKRLNVPWLIHHLSPVEEKAKTHDGKTVVLMRSRLAALYNSQRDRFGRTWEDDYARIVAARKARGVTAEETATTTQTWAKDLQNSLKADDQVTSQFEATAASRQALKRKGFVGKMLSSARLKFLALAMGGVGAVSVLPRDSAPVEFLTAIGTHIVQATEKTPAEMVIKPITDFGGMIGNSMTSGNWLGFALLSGGFAFCVSQYFLGHLLAAGVATMRGKTGDFFTRSTNQMWDLYCRIIRPWTMPEQLKRWIFNAGRTDRALQARSPENLEALKANLKGRANAQAMAAQLATLVAEAQKKAAAGDPAANDALVSEVLTNILAAATVGEASEIPPDLLVALMTSNGPGEPAPTADQIRERTEALMTDPQQIERLVTVRGLLVRTLTAVADADPSALPVNGEVLKAKIALYQQLAAQIKTAEISSTAKTAMGRGFNSFCKFTSRHLLTFKDFMGQVLMGVKGAEIARQAGKPVPEHIKNGVIHRAIIDFFMSEFNGAILEPKTFTLPTSISGMPGFMPAAVGSWEQTFSWLMIPIGNMMFTMARPHKLKQSAEPFESLATEMVEPNMQSLESYIIRMFANNFSWDPESPGFFKNVFSYIKAGVLQHKARCGFLALCLLAGFLITKFTGDPEQAAKINLWTIPLVAWISAYNISFAKCSISPWHVGYALSWPGVDLGDVNTIWAEKNQHRIQEALGQIGSTSPELRQHGIRSMKELYHEGYKSLPAQFNKDSADFSEEEAADFFAHVLTKLPLPNRASALGHTLLNVAGVTFTTLIYFAVFKGLLSGAPSVAQAAIDFAFITTWMGITAVGALSLDWASRMGTKWFKPMTKAIGAGVDGIRRACREMLGETPINLK